MKQFHSSVIPEFTGLVGQYIRSSIEDAMAPNKKATAYPIEAQKMFLFLDIFSKFGNIPRRLIEEHVPPYLYAEFLSKRG